MLLYTYAGKTTQVVTARKQSQSTKSVHKTQAI